jgi:hypothetical protein
LSVDFFLADVEILDVKEAYSTGERKKWLADRV